MSSRVYTISPGVLEAGFTAIPNLVLRRTDLSGNAKTLYAVILDVVQFQRAEPDSIELGKLIGGSEKIARKAIRELADVGLLTVKRRGQGNTNQYTLLEPQTGQSVRSESDEPSDPSVLVRPEEDKEMLTHLSSDIQNVYDYWRTKRHKTRSNYDRVSPGRRAKLKARLAEFTAAELCAAIDGVGRDPWPERAMHDDITVIFRSREQVERFLEMDGAKNGTHLTPYERARAWVQSVGWQYSDADLIEEIARFSVTDQERKRLADLAITIQAAAA